MNPSSSNSDSQTTGMNMDMNRDIDESSMQMTKTEETRSDDDNNKKEEENQNDAITAQMTMKTTMTAKYGKQTITLPNLSSHTTTIGKVKQLLFQETNILPKRQKLIGLAAATKNNKNNGTVGKKSTMIDDECTLDNLQIKKPKECIYDKTTNQLIHTYHSFILMGTPEAEIFIDPDPNNTNDLTVNDFDFDLNINSEEYYEHFVNQQNLQKFTLSTNVYIMNPPREGKKLMVLDLDHTLLDFSSKKIVNNSHDSTTGTTATSSITTARTTEEIINQMKRPFMDEFLSAMYQHYDLVVWSQTSWRWLETKLVELGMLTNPNYRFCFVLDKTSMFAITSTRKRSNSRIQHYVKPLQIIWSKFPIWNEKNTIHLDDLSRNFALNVDNGLKVSAYYRKKRKNGNGTIVVSSSNNRKNDVELIGLIGYCTKLAKECDDFTNVDFKYWKDVVNGTRELVTKTSTSSAAAASTTNTRNSDSSSSNGEKKKQQGN